MTSSALHRLTQHRRFVPLTLLGIVLVGAYFRLSDLGLAAFRGDEGFFVEIFAMEISPLDIFTKWMQLQGFSGQMPFSAAFTKWFLQVLDFAPTHFTVRLPSALWGIATILAAFGAGRALAGPFFGLVMALLLALNPYHLQISREAYHYPPLVCGAFLGFWSALSVVDQICHGKPIGQRLYLVNALGFFLLTYSQPSGWPLALFLVLTVAWGAARELRNTKRLTLPYVWLLLTFLVIGLPLVFVDWGLPQQLKSSSAEMRAAVAAVFRERPLLPDVWQGVVSYSWGATPLRVSFSVLVLVCGIAVSVLKTRVDKRFVLAPLFLLAGFGFALLSLQARGASFSSRYALALLPLLLTILASGIMWADELVRWTPEKRKRIGLWARGIFLALAVVLWVGPAFLCMQLTGKPTPYKLINAWADGNLPPGTLILVDRWFEPWCEFRIESPTNVIYTFTVPDEPLEAFLQLDWRGTATNFFAKYPDAAYLELTKHYFDAPEVGPWEWPRQFFARRVAITNEAGLKLRSIGLANREDYYAQNTNRVIVELFYNAREDLLAREKAAQHSHAAFFGGEWGYLKTDDHRDWRLLSEASQVDLYNLTDQTNTALVTVLGLPASAVHETNSLRGIEYVARAGELSKWTIGPQAVAPGKVQVRLDQVGWDKATRPFLVSGITVEAVTEADEKGKAQEN